MSLKMLERDVPTRSSPATARLGFLGTGWIGRMRLEALSRLPNVEVAAIADPSAQERASAARLAPEAALSSSLDELLEQPLDGIVIATPSALHAIQAIRAFERGVAVFCQKPLGRDAAEVRAVVDAARAADRLLGLDLSYRHTRAMQAIRGLIARGDLGAIRLVDLVFHNAYGPDKPWFYDRALSGGGCLMDLGIHLVDLALWALDFPQVEEASGWLGGYGASPGHASCEDQAFATLRLQGGTLVRIACSWRLHAGRDAEISVAFYGSDGGAAMRNVGGSFYDFAAEHYRGTAMTMLAEPPDDWGGRAALRWAERLLHDPGYRPEAERFVDVARVLERIYAGA